MSSHVLRFGSVVLVSVVLKYILMNSSYQEEIASRVEVSTPVSSWKRGMFSYLFY